MLTHGGAVVHPAFAEKDGAASPKAMPAAPEKKTAAKKKGSP
jgi:hypothetical protein